MEAYNHLECEYNYRAAVKGSPQERKGAFGESGQAGRTCGQVLDRMTEAVSDALALAPEDLRREYGSDCLRLYLLFMGPGREYQREEAWDEDTMAGLFRYLGPRVCRQEQNSRKSPEMGYRRGFCIRVSADHRPDPAGTISRRSDYADVPSEKEDP